MQESELIRKAKLQIDAVRGKTLSIEDRKNRAIALAAVMLEEAERIQTRKEKQHQALLAGMMRDPIGKTVTTLLTDQCFRSRRPERIADQLVYIIDQIGIPHYLPFSKRLALRAFALLGKAIPTVTVPLAIQMLRQEASSVILPGEPSVLTKHLKKDAKRVCALNLNHLGEAILGEEEAKRRLGLFG